MRTRTLKRPKAKGHAVSVNTDALRRLAVSQGVSMNELERRAELCSGHMAHILQRGRCKEYVLDELASKLGVSFWDLYVPDGGEAA